MVMKTETLDRFAREHLDDATTYCPLDPTQKLRPLSFQFNDFPHLDEETPEHDTLYIVRFRVQV